MVSIDYIKNYITAHRLLSAEGLHLVGLSGGADSVCLLLVLCRLGYRVEAAHCNFHLRGEESERDESFVKALCERLGVRLHLIHFDTKTYAELHRVGIEMAARELRYHYFEQLRQDIGAESVCVAHHQDDQVETVLMNLLRGTGLRGLSGIQPRQGHIVRPLLCVSRSEIEQWLTSQGQDYVVDSTNLEQDTARNVLRLDVLPRLRRQWSAADQSILKTQRRVTEALKVYEAAVESSLSRLLHNDSIAIADLAIEPSPESLLFEWLAPSGFSGDTIESIANRLSLLQTGRTWQSASHELYVHDGRLCLAPIAPERPTLRIPEPGNYVYDDLTKLCVKSVDQWSVGPSEWFCHLDADRFRFPLTVRPVARGDRFQPLGMTGTKLVSEFLTNRHVSVHAKRRQLIVVDAAGQPLWLPGHRIDHRVRITPGTTKVIRMEITIEGGPLCP